VNQEKHNKFLRLAKLRGERALRDIQLIGNLSNKNNYNYTDQEVQLLFRALEDELKVAKYSFARKRKEEIKF
jgi:hypothetical protein